MSIQYQSIFITFRASVSVERVRLKKYWPRSITTMQHANTGLEVNRVNIDVE